MISLKVRLGRLIRISIRGIEKSKCELSENDAAILFRVKNIHAQVYTQEKGQGYLQKRE